MKNKTQYILASLSLILAISLVLGGCSLRKEKDQPEKNDLNGENAGLANPASIFCEEQGGETEIIEGESGQQGICNLPDGSSCDEWEFYRGECGNNSKIKNQNAKNETDGNIKIFNIQAGDAVVSPLKIEGETSATEGQVTVELRNNNRDTLVKEMANIGTGENEKGVFSINLHYVFVGTKEGYIAVYQPGENNQELNLVEIPVKFGE